MKIKFVPQDVWIGLYWKTEQFDDDVSEAFIEVTTWYLCLLPCLPIIWQTEKDWS